MHMLLQIGVIGTLGYMAPELSLSRGVNDPARDMYAYGVMLYKAHVGIDAQVVPALVDSNSPSASGTVFACDDDSRAFDPSSHLARLLNALVCASFYCHNVTSHCVLPHRNVSITVEY